MPQISELKLNSRLGESHLVLLMPLLIISNTVSGSGEGKAIINEHVIPLLSSKGVTFDELHETTSPTSAGLAACKFIRTHKSNVSLIISGGDGTVHDVINELAKSDVRHLAVRVSIALVPSGTANALYASLYPPDSNISSEIPIEYKLQSVRSLLTNGSQRRLVIARTSIWEEKSGETGPTNIYSIVVASTSLHATILKDSEALRETIKDMSRFRVAAERNIDRWYDARASLLPTAGGLLQRYDCSEGKFDNVSEDARHLDGPFVYFLSTVNVDRLEPAFNITPLNRDLTEDSMDIIVVRPGRCRQLTGSNEEQRKAFAPRLIQILQAAYQKGAHISLKYTEDGSLHNDGDGESAVEYFRCGGWEWIPVRLFSYK